MIAKLLSVNPRLRPTTGDILHFPWLKHDSEGSPDFFRGNTDSHPDPTVMVIMRVMGYKKREIREALQKNVDQVMATYLILRQQSPWGDNFKIKLKPRRLGRNLNLTGAAMTAKVTLKRASSVPSLPTFLDPNIPQSPEHDKGGKRRYSWPPTLTCLNNKTTPLLKICPQRSREAHFMSSTSWNTNSTDTSGEICPKVTAENVPRKPHCRQSSWMC